jgi:hypothetical protein
MALSSIAFGVLYFFFNILPFCFKKKGAAATGKASTTRFEDGVVEERRSLNVKSKTTIQKGNDTVGDETNRLSDIAE